MLKFVLSLTMILSMSLLISCQSRVASSAGIGYQLTTPQKKTAEYIVKNDRKFANQVAGNNRICKMHKGCIKP